MLTRVRLLVPVAFILGLVPVSAQHPASAKVPIDDAREWFVDAASRIADVRTAPFQERQALWLRNGTQAVADGAPFRDGTIELDVAPMEHGDFVAIVFRRESSANHENIYLRPRQSGEFMAIQYAPRTNGSSTWQLYPEFTAKASWPRNQWTHVRVEVHGSALEVFVGDATTPTLMVSRLRHESLAGDVGFWARVNDRPQEWAAALSNIQIRRATTNATRTPPPAPGPGVVAEWQVSTPISPAAGVVGTLPAGLTWKTVRSEESGLVNLNRLFQAQPLNGRQTVFLRTTLDAASAQRRLAGIGYSDEVTVFVNGEPIYSGVNGWESRLPEYVGFVDPRFERVWLPLRAGANEIMLAVTDDQRFGWGASLSWVSAMP